MPDFFGPPLNAPQQPRSLVGAGQSAPLQQFLDQPGTFLPWTYNDQPTPQQRFRDEDNPNIATENKLRGYMMWMQQNLSNPHNWFAVPDSQGRAGTFGIPPQGWGV